MHAKDERSSHIFQLVLLDDRDQGILSVPCTLDVAQEYQGEKILQEFYPSQEWLANVPPSLALFEWLLLLFASACKPMLEANDSGFSKALLTFGRLSALVNCSEDCRSLLSRFLLAAEEYFRGKDSSNSKRRECLEILGRLNPALAADVEGCLREIEDKDILLRQREQRIIEAAQRFGRESAMQNLDYECVVGRAWHTRRQILERVPGPGRSS
jgi:hypothetical protein